MKKIVLVGLFTYDNLGDQILRDTCEYLVNQIIKENNFTNAIVEKLDMMPQLGQKNNKSKNILYKFVFYIRLGLMRIFNLTKDKKIIDFLIYLENKLNYGNSYRKQLRDCSAIIFVGGAYLKYQGENFQYCIRYIIKYANQRKIPVMFNAIGIEGYSEADVRCQKLKKAVNSNCVKYITTRDDIELLNNKFITNNQCVTALVGDNALWIPECYRISYAEGSECVGVNISYLNLFEIYNLPYTEEDYIAIFKELLNKLDKKKIKYKLFCNGKSTDFEGGKQLVKVLNLSNEKLLCKAETAKELVLQIAQFGCVLPLRLHACITAYSLGIPSVGFVWNKKVEKFARIVGMENNFHSINELSIDKLIDTVLQVLNSDFDNSKKNELKILTKIYLQEFIINVIEEKY